MYRVKPIVNIWAKPKAQHHVDGDHNNNLIRQYSFGDGDYKRNSRSAPDLLDMDDKPRGKDFFLETWSNL